MGLEESAASVCHPLDGSKRLWRNPLPLSVTQWTVQMVLEESSAYVCHLMDGAKKFWTNPLPLSVAQWTVPRGFGGIRCLCLSHIGRCQEALEESAASVCHPVDGAKKFWRNPLPLSVIQWTVPTGSS